MKYLLDSNAWISVFRKTSVPLQQRLEHCLESEIALCSIVLGELWYGAIRSGPANFAFNQALVDDLRSRYVSLPFDDGSAQEYADIRAHLSSMGKVIGPNDLQIASIARYHNLVVVTHNTAEFNRVPRLVLEDWQTT